MNKILSFLAITSLGFNISLPAQAIRISANDIVCSFQYRIDGGAWIIDSVGGTTRGAAKQYQTQVLQGLEKRATGSFESRSLGCVDPYK